MQRFTTSDGLSLAFQVSGEGLPLLCLPGLTRNHHDFDDLRAVLPEGLRMIALTSRGREPSDFAPDPMSYDIPTEARDALELLDHLGIARAVILGTSRGGLIAMVIAALAPQRLSGVLLNDIGPEIDADGLSRIMDYLGRRPAARDMDALAVKLAETMGAGFPDFDAAMWDRLARRWYREDAEGIALRYDPRLRDAVLAKGAAPDLWPLFDALAGIPLAVLRGQHSDLLRADTLRQMQARRPDLIAATVPGRGHVPLLDEAESLAVLNTLVERVRT
ncbi:alpha/beta fold hydrolase [Halovulum dunhuangense]|uniref:Alpha/beta fold hydrolase n=1 Tax=Halovulum dunhuangense TaxID=1505036 RepID=A0A849L063_9RHOB|nr:alpha/beta hydrolase [Halovulum dunhuangense]NNU79310.1 alpha/beta fold hydrolase [Halovulum dunhuangense]